MKSELKYVTIDTFSKEDLRELFDHIAIRVLKSNPVKIRQEGLGLKGSHKELEAHNPTISSILTLIATYDIKFKFTVEYGQEVEDDFSNLPPEDKTKVVKEMESQRKDVEPVAVEEKVEAPIKKEREYVKVEEEKKPIDESEIPDFS